MRTNLVYTIMKWIADFFTDVWGWIGGCIGLVIGLWTGLPALGQSVLIVQMADIATGIACAALGKSQKSESGKVSSRVMLEGVIKKGAEWLIVLVCVYAGSPLGMEGIGSAAMTYVIATELVSLLENLALLGLNAPLIETILDVAQGEDTRKEKE
ncbi:MAG: phage holin family protein [Clostridia bacterium]|nr:phage holin family protein [Clostridia bacterium]